MPGVFETHPWIGALAVIASLAAAAAVVAAPAIAQRCGGRWPALAAAVWIVTRLGLLAVILAVLGRASGPDRDYWASIAVPASHGRLPYVDFRCEQAPFFPFLLVPGVLAFGRDLGPIATFLLFDLLAFVALHAIADDARTGRSVAALYLFSPLSWVMVVRFGQDEPIAVLLAALLFVLARRGRTLAQAVVAGVGLACTKVLVLLTVVPVLLRSRRPARSIGIALLLLALAYLPFALRGGDLLQYLPSEHAYMGTNVWAALYPFVRVPWGVAMAVNAVVFGALGILVLARARRADSVDAVLALFAGLMLTSPKAYHPFALLVLPFLAWRVVRAASFAERAAFAAYSFLMAIHFEAMSFASSGRLAAAVASTMAFAIVGYHAWLLATSVRALSRAGASAAG